MRVYGIMPWQVGELTDAEWFEVIRDQDAEFKAIKDAVRQAKRQQPRRR